MKIVKIISQTSVVMNAGLAESVKVGQRFQIIGKNGEQVIDPETGKSLGTLDEIKGTVEATHVYPAMTILETLKHRSKTPINQGFAQTMIYGPEIPDQLNVKREDISGGMPSSDSPIEIGDEVIAI